MAIAFFDRSSRLDRPSAASAPAPVPSTKAPSHQMPKPSTKSAYLVSEGYAGKLVATRHVYVETELRAGFYVYIFECAKTGARRTWGNWGNE